MRQVSENTGVGVGPILLTWSRRDHTGKDGGRLSRDVSPVSLEKVHTWCTIKKGRLPRWR